MSKEDLGTRIITATSGTLSIESYSPSIVVAGYFVRNGSHIGLLASYPEIMAL